MTTQQVPVYGQVTTVAKRVSIASLYGSAGDTLADSTDSTSVEVINDGGSWPI